MDTKVTILTKNGEVIALCYTADCSEARSLLAELSEQEYEEVTPVPMPINSHAADSELLFTFLAQNDVEFHPPAKTLHLGRLKSGSPRQLKFKCYSTSGGNASVQLVIAEGVDIVDQEAFDVECKRKGLRKDTKGRNTASFIDRGHLRTLNAQGAHFDITGKKIVHTHNVHFHRDTKPTNNQETNSENQGPSIIRRFFMAGIHARRFIKDVNETSRRESRGGVTDKFKGGNLCEPDFEVYCRMHQPTRVFLGGLIPMNDYKGERICTPSADTLGKTEMVSPKELLSLICSTEEKARFIAVLGMAGSGKTTLIKRLVRDVMKPTHWLTSLFISPRFRIVRFLNVKDIDDITQPVNAMEVLFPKETLPNLETNDIYFGYEWARKNESKILFAIDGLDQATWDIPPDFKKINYTDKASVSVVMANILSGNLFPRSKILLTSREHSVTCLDESVRPTTIVAMLGLDLKDAEKLFNELIGSGAFQTLPPALIPLCSIPLFLVFCAIIFIIKPGVRPNTMSALVHEILQTFFRSKHAEKPVTRMADDHVIAFFKSISLEAIMKRQVTFDWQVFESKGFSPKKISQFAIKVPDPATYSQRLFDSDYKVFFSHQSLQEKFASMEICEKESNNFRSFASKDLCQPHLSVVRRFVCGLLSVVGKTSEIVSIEDREEKWEIFKEILQQQAANATSSDERLELLALLYESQDQDLIRSLVTEIDYADVAFTPATAHALATILTSCRHLRLFRLKNCRLDEECLDILERVTEKVELQVDVAEISVSMASLLRPGCFIENLHADLLVLLEDSPSTTNSTLLSSQLFWCPFVAVVVDAESREVISFFFPKLSEEEPLVLPVSHKIIVPDPLERAKPVNEVVIEGPCKQLLKVENLITYLRPKLLILLLTDDTEMWSKGLGLWPNMTESCIMVFKVNHGDYYELLLSSPFRQETCIPLDCQGTIASVLQRIRTEDVVVIEGEFLSLLKLENFLQHLNPKILCLLLNDDTDMRTTQATWSLHETFVMVFKVNLGEYYELLPSSHFCQETVMPDGCHRKIASTLNARIQMPKKDVVVIEGSSKCLLDLGNLIKHLRPKILVLLLTDSAKNCSALPTWSLDKTCVMLFKVDSVGYVELLPSSPFCRETVIPDEHHEKIKATLKKRVETVDTVVIEGLSVRLLKLERFIKNLRPKVLVLLLTDSDKNWPTRSDWSSDETCVIVLDFNMGEYCQLLTNSPFCRETVVPSGYQEQIVSTLEGRLKTIELLDVSKNPQLRRNNGFVVAGSTVKRCNVKKVAMKSCKIETPHMKDFANGAENARIELLDVSMNPELRGNKGFNVVGSTVAQCSVKQVVMRECKIQSSHMKDFAEGARNTKIELIDVMNNSELRSNKGFYSFGSTVAQCGIEKVKMLLCMMDGTHMKDFGDGVGDTKIVHLDVSFNWLLTNHNGFKQVGATVAKCKVEEVAMQQCLIRGYDMRDFASGAVNAEIIHLIVSCNITLRHDGGFFAVGSTVAQCKVKQLDMAACEMEASHVKEFKSGLGNAKIIALVLNSNKVNRCDYGPGLGEEGLDEIIRIVHENEVKLLVMKDCDFELDQLERVIMSLPTGVDFIY